MNSFHLSFRFQLSMTFHIFWAYCLMFWVWVCVWGGVRACIPVWVHIHAICSQRLVSDGFLNSFHFVFWNMASQWHWSSLIPADWYKQTQGPSASYIPNLRLQVHAETLHFYVGPRDHGPHAWVRSTEPAKPSLELWYS